MEKHIHSKEELMQMVEDDDLPTNLRKTYQEAKTIMNIMKQDIMKSYSHNQRKSINIPGTAAS